MVASSKPQPGGRIKSPQSRFGSILMPLEILHGTNFATVDWIIVGLYLAISVMIGLEVRRYVNSMAAYVGAGRQVGTWLGIATMTGTEMGLITVMYNAEAGAKGGFAAFHIGVIAGLVTLIIGLSGFIVGPLRRHGVLTIPEYYERRYGRNVRIVGGIILAGAGILNMGLFLKYGSVFIVGITGMNPNGNAVATVMTVMLLLVLFYTVLGGMISVVITDYLQFVVLSFGIVVTTVLAINQLGWQEIVSTVESRMQLGGFDPTASPVFGPSYVMWMIAAGLVSCAIWPTAVARALAMKDEQSVRRQYTFSSISFAVRAIIPMFWGVCTFVWIANHAPENIQQHFLPNQTGGINPELEDRFYAMPIYLGQLLPSGLIGVITAAMVAAFMSTHDSYLLCWSSVITQDVIAPLKNDNLSVRARIAITRCGIVCIGIFVWWWGLFYPGGGGLWEYMVITGAIYFTGAGVLLVGGLYWSRASRRGAMAALLTGCTALLGLGPIRTRLTDLLQSSTGLELKLTEAHVGLFSVCLTIVVFVLVSLCCPDDPAEDPLTAADDELAAAGEES